MSNPSDLKFSDEEVITIYLFGIIDGRTKNSDIYEYANRHLRDCFPKLPSYTAFIQRLNKVSGTFCTVTRNNY
ncbi:MAG: hypothetical protein KAG43_04400 [Candidatus Marithrix sp.]|nr:hypothetical protein [Candidatus Marithrix sp.]